MVDFNWGNSGRQTRPSGGEGPVSLVLLLWSQGSDRPICSVRDDRSCYTTASHRTCATKEEKKEPGEKD